MACSTILRRPPEPHLKWRRPRHEICGQDQDVGARARRRDSARGGRLLRARFLRLRSRHGARWPERDGDAYAGIGGHIAEADLNLGCGVPTRLAALAAGETVLDLGSGAGNDAFIARHEVGPEGRVIGVDNDARDDR
jgi:hypothetical protein